VRWTGSWLALLGALLLGCGEEPGGSPAAVDAESPPESASEMPALWSDQDPRITRLLTPRTDDPLERDPPAVRVLVSYSATNYFVDSGRQRGLEYELMRGFEEFLAKRSDSPIPPRVVFVALPFDRLIQGIAEGRGDVAAAGLTITPERLAQVGFSEPYRHTVREVVVRHRDALAVPTASALSGRVVRVLRGSSYADHLAVLSAELQAAGREPIRVEMADSSLQSEDLLQLVHAGVYDYTLVDDHLASLWSQVLDGIVVEPASINEGGNLAWAIRKENRRLREQLDAYARSRRQGTLTGNVLFRRYYADTRWIRDPGEAETQDRLARWRSKFERYGAQYGFDWLALASVAIQESGLDQQARSAAGAVGIMQIRPSTAADPNVGIAGVENDADANIHAGTRYLAFLRKRYFSDPEISDDVRFDFTVAAYNAGPRMLSRLRAKAAGEGLDPNQWFGHVEHVARRIIGRETVDYVGNVNKYYVAFRSLRPRLEARAE
jgi:membrane-bound lytic murein transglycosylase MltF